MRKPSVLLLLVLAVAACKRGEQATTATTTATTTAPTTATARRDKVVLLNLWATWCGPCRVEIPELQTIHGKYAPRGFEVVGVSVDEGAPEVVKAFVDEQKMTYPVVHDPEGRLAGLLDASVLPTTVLVDRGGRIVWKKIGAIMPQDESLSQAIEQALSAGA